MANRKTTIEMIAEKAGYRRTVLELGSRIRLDRQRDAS